MQHASKSMHAPCLTCPYGQRDDLGHDARHQLVRKLSHPHGVGRDGQLVGHGRLGHGQHPLDELLAKLARGNPHGRDGGLVRVQGGKRGLPVVGHPVHQVGKPVLVHLADPLCHQREGSPKVCVGPVQRIEEFVQGKQILTTPPQHGVPVRHQRTVLLLAPYLDEPGKRYPDVNYLAKQLHACKMKTEFRQVIII